jgi:hypothetical protein
MCTRAGQQELLSDVQVPPQVPVAGANDKEPARFLAGGRSGFYPFEIGVLEAVKSRLSGEAGARLQLSQAAEARASPQEARDDRRRIKELERDS